MFKPIRKTTAIAVLAAFLTAPLPIPAFTAAQGPWLPQPGIMVHLSPEFTPALLKGIVIHPEDALKFDFIIYKGDRPLADKDKKREYTKLIKYFLASLAVPEDNQWVNLSPYEKDRIIKQDFGRTGMGRDLLAQDYILKQVTASLIYPQARLGQEFWDKVYAKAYKEFGTTDIPVNTFNKVWIVPDHAEIFEKGNMAYVLKNHLKVMLEEDYLSLKKHTGIAMAGSDAQDKTHTLGSQVVREIVLPVLEKEVNEGKNFASLRQVFSGVVLAAWYKRELRESLLGKVYMNKSRLKGVDQDPKNNELIYEQYLKAFKKGVFNFIKEDYNKYSHETIPRKYFSGGTLARYTANTLAILPATPEREGIAAGELNNEDVVTESNFEEVKGGSDAAMLNFSAVKELPHLLGRTMYKKLQAFGEGMAEAEKFKWEMQMAEAQFINRERFQNNLPLIKFTFKKVIESQKQDIDLHRVLAAKQEILQQYGKVTLSFLDLPSPVGFEDMNYMYQMPFVRLMSSFNGIFTIFPVIFLDGLKLNVQNFMDLLPEESEIKADRAMATARPSEILPGKTAVSQANKASPQVTEIKTASAAANELAPGGIDFNTANFDLLIKRDGHGTPLPFAQQDLARLNDLEGLAPVILHIRPASQTLLFSSRRNSSF